MGCWWLLVGKGKGALRTVAGRLNTSNPNWHLDPEAGLRVTQVRRAPHPSAPRASKSFRWLAGLGWAGLGDQ